MCYWLWAADPTLLYLRAYAYWTVNSWNAFLRFISVCKIYVFQSCVLLWFLLFVSFAFNVACCDVYHLYLYIWLCADSFFFALASLQSPLAIKCHLYLAANISRCCFLGWLMRTPRFGICWSGVTGHLLTGENQGLQCFDAACFSMWVIICFRVVLIPVNSECARARWPWHVWFIACMPIWWG